MKHSYFLLLFLCFSCAKNQDPKEHIPHLSGYWEIDNVTFPDGSQKKFQINTIIDYIEIQGDSGFRKKLAPKLDGTFQTTNRADSFYLNIDGDSLRLQYKTPYSEWTETVLKTGDSLLEVRNENGKIYSYKRFKPIKILP